MIPTPRGLVRVELRGDTREAELTVPAGVEVRVPDEVRAKWTLRLRYDDAVITGGTRAVL